MSQKYSCTFWTPVSTLVYLTHHQFFCFYLLHRSLMAASSSLPSTHIINVIFFLPECYCCFLSGFPYPFCLSHHITSVLHIVARLIFENVNLNFCLPQHKSILCLPIKLRVKTKLLTFADKAPLICVLSKSPSSTPRFSSGQPDLQSLYSLYLALSQILCASRFFCWKYSSLFSLITLVDSSDYNPSITFSESLMRSRAPLI